MDTGDTTRPRVICLVHGRVRYCDQHLRAEFPPDAAKKWMKRNCGTPDNGCDIQYRAGIVPRGSIRGQ